MGLQRWLCNCFPFILFHFFSCIINPEHENVHFNLLSFQLKCVLTFKVSFWYIEKTLAVLHINSWPFVSEFNGEKNIWPIKIYFMCQVPNHFTVFARWPSRWHNGTIMFWARNVSSLVGDKTLLHDIFHRSKRRLLTSHIRVKFLHKKEIFNFLANYKLSNEFIAAI